MGLFNITAGYLGEIVLLGEAHKKIELFNMCSDEFLGGRPIGNQHAERQNFPAIKMMSTVFFLLILVVVLLSAEDKPLTTPERQKSKLHHHLNIYNHMHTYWIHPSIFVRVQ